jgi:photosystem II stability/assembly factor-like uncharacterized protein
MVAVVNVSPVRSRMTFGFNREDQSVSGKGLCVAMSADGMRLYLGGHSGVWRSDDGGMTWTHPERPQPLQGATNVLGALLPTSVYDLLTSPADSDTVLAATGRDSRRPEQNGIYRSTDGARSWQRVHQFAGASGRFGSVGSITVAPDDRQLMFAGGQFAVGLSTDAGLTWTERTPQTSANQRVYYVVSSAAQSNGARHVYAAGSRIWHSPDGGLTWSEDATTLKVGAPADGPGSSPRCLCVDPTNALQIYVARYESDSGLGEVWRGTLPSSGSGDMTWKKLPSPPKNPDRTASGTDFILVHRAPDGSRQFFFSDRRNVYASDGEPAVQSDWKVLDASPVHVDPHGIAVTSRFSWAGSGTPSGRIVLVNDGGSVVSTDGAGSWEFGSGLTTLGLVNTAVLPREGKDPVIVIQTGDNNGFISPDGGRNWETQDYRGGDNAPSFADPRQPERLFVFAGRHNITDEHEGAVFLYAASSGDVPDGSWGTNDRHTVPSPDPLPGETFGRWNVRTKFFQLGYRPLILTLERESPLPDGDFCTIVLSDDGASARLLRTTKMSSITVPSDWVTSATADGANVKAFRQGPSLPSATIGVVQTSGGHANPTFYIGDQDEKESQLVWSWRRGQTGWQVIVPAAGSGPALARRFFVDPYRPAIIYVLGHDHMWRTENGGTSWTVDQALETALSEGGAFPIEMTTESDEEVVLLRDMVFDPVDAEWRIAVGPAGIFQTLDGRTWRHLLVSSAAATRPNNACCDRITFPCARMLYVSTRNSGVLRLGPLPPDWEALPGRVTAAVGQLTLLRVHDVGTKFGPRSDQLDVEVVVQVDTEPGRSFGFQLRNDGDREANEGMLSLLREAFDLDQRIRIEFIRTACSKGEIIRVILESEGGPDGIQDFQGQADVASSARRRDEVRPKVRSDRRRGGV